MSVQRGSLSQAFDWCGFGIAECLISVKDSRTGLQFEETVYMPKNTATKQYAAKVLGEYGYSVINFDVTNTEYRTIGWKPLFNAIKDERRSTK